MTILIIIMPYGVEPVVIDQRRLLGALVFIKAEVKGLSDRKIGVVDIEPREAVSPYMPALIRVRLRGDERLISLRIEELFMPRYLIKALAVVAGFDRERRDRILDQLDLRVEIAKALL